MIEVFDESKQEKQLIAFLDRSATRTEIIQHFNKLTIHDVVGNEEYKSLRALARLYDNEKITNGIAILLKDTSKAYDKVWSAAKAKETAAEIFHSEYSYITLEDVFVLLKRIKENDFSYTPASLMKQLKKYGEERFEVAKEKSLNHHYANKFVDNSERDTAIERGRHQKALKQHNYNETLKKEKQHKTSSLVKQYEQQLKKEHK